MKTPKPNNKKRVIIVASVVAALLIFGGVGAFYLNRPNTDDIPDTETTSDTFDNSPATTDEIEAGEQIKRDSLEKNDTGETPAPSGEIQKVGVIITAANQVDGQLLVRSMIDTISNDGVCTLTLQKSDGTIVTKTAGVQASASSSTCKGFDVPLSELSSGEWRITVTYKSDILEGAAGHTVTI